MIFKNQTDPSFWQKSITMAEDEIDEMVKKLVKSKEISTAEGTRLKKEIIGFTTSLKGWISDAIDKRFKEVLSATNLATKDHISELNSRINTLEKKLKKLEKIQAKTKTK